MSDQGVFLEWFGVTTYRLRACGLTIFLDCWLDKPQTFPKHITIEQAAKDGADYIFISHAHFDHLPGTAALATATGAIVVGNCEAVSRCRAMGVPEEQLQRVSGGERIPCFTKSVFKAATAREIETAPDLPNAPPRPHVKHAALVVQVWPGLHCLLPNAPAVSLPDKLDTGMAPNLPSDPSSAEFASTMDITRLMEYGFLKIADLVKAEARDVHMASLITWLERQSGNHAGSCLSACDGGNLMYNLLFPTGSGQKALLWNAQLGYYSGILQALDPKPDFAILSVAGQGNLNGKPVSVSGAEFIVEQLKVLKEPARVMWCLCDDSPVKPFRVITSGEHGVTERVKRETNSKVIEIGVGLSYRVW